MEIIIWIRQIIYPERGYWHPLCILIVSGLYMCIWVWLVHTRWCDKVGPLMCLAYGTPINTLTLEVLQPVFKCHLDKGNVSEIFNNDNGDDDDHLHHHLNDNNNDGDDDDDDNDDKNNNDNNNNGYKNLIKSVLICSHTVPAKMLVSLIFYMWDQQSVLNDSMIISLNRSYGKISLVRFQF